MKSWEEPCALFISKFENNEEVTDEQIEDFIEAGLKPLLEDFLDLKEAANSLIESNFQIFNQVLSKPNHKMKNSSLYKSIAAVMNITKDETQIQ